MPPLLCVIITCIYSPIYSPNSLICKLLVCPLHVRMRLKQWWILKFDSCWILLRETVLHWSPHQVSLFWVWPACKLVCGSDLRWRPASLRVTHCPGARRAPPLLLNKRSSAAAARAGCCPAAASLYNPAGPGVRQEGILVGQKYTWLWTRFLPLFFFFSFLPLLKPIL